MAEVISLSRPANPDEVATIAAAGHRFADGPMPGPGFDLRPQNAKAIRRRSTGTRCA
jgi:hypothetical protein